MMKPASPAAEETGFVRFMDKTALKMETLRKSGNKIAA